MSFKIGLITVWVRCSLYSCDRICVGEIVQEVQNATVFAPLLFPGPMTASYKLLPAASSSIHPTAGFPTFPHYRGVHVNVSIFFTGLF